MAEDTRSRPATPQATFDAVASYYDHLNAFLSLGLDSAWRRRAAQRLDCRDGAHVLDVATGTGALARTLLDQLPPSAHVIGCDLNRRMLSVASTSSKQSHGRFSLVRCRGEQLPFPDGFFDTVTIAFAIDDMDDRDACAREMTRVLRPGGQLLLLELSLPDHPPWSTLYRTYLRILPRIARLIHRDGGHDHLRDEILRYRGREAIQHLLTASGITNYWRESLTGGIATVHVGRRVTG